ncbi:MAG: bactofilin family protein [Candidatus Aminicenantales bacterium]
MKDKDKDKARDFMEMKLAGLIDQGTVMNGDLSFKGSFRIEGFFKGTIHSDSLLIIGERGKVEADIKVNQIVINGEVRGTVQGFEKIEIHNKGRVFGTIITPKLIIEEGAFLEANCRTTENEAPVGAETDEKAENRS